MRTLLYLSVAHLTDDMDAPPIYALSSSREGAHLAMWKILREEAIDAHGDDTPSDDLINEYIKCEYVIEEPIALPLHGDTRFLAGYLWGWG